MRTRTCDANKWRQEPIKSHVFGCKLTGHEEPNVNAAQFVIGRESGLSKLEFDGLEVGETDGLA